MSTQALREFLDRHFVSVTGLSALAAALDARTTGAALDPRLASRIEELLAILGAGEILEGVSAQEAAPFLNELRTMMMLSTRLLQPHTRQVGWKHTETDLLQPIGDFSRNFAQAMTRMVIPALPGLADRMRSASATFLDIGTGVGALSIAMAQMWPELRVLGIDPWAPSLNLARQNVERAGLKSRIELREQGIEKLEDRAAFDLAWLPLQFIPESVPAFATTLGALKPGGWVVTTAGNFAVMKPENAAAQRLLMSNFGGPSWGPDEIQVKLRECGFDEVHTIATPPTLPVVIIVARRPV